MRIKSITKINMSDVNLSHKNNSEFALGFLGVSIVGVSFLLWMIWSGADVPVQGVVSGSGSGWLIFFLAIMIFGFVVVLISPKQLIIKGDLLEFIYFGKELGIPLSEVQQLQVTKRERTKDGKKQVRYRLSLVAVAGKKIVFNMSGESGERVYTHLKRLEK